jgi:hypothetical protein
VPKFTRTLLCIRQGVALQASLWCVGGSAPATTTSNLEDGRRGLDQATAGSSGDSAFRRAPPDGSGKRVLCGCLLRGKVTWWLTAGSWGKGPPARPSWCSGDGGGLPPACLHDGSLPASCSVTAATSSSRPSPAWGSSNLPKRVAGLSEIEGSCGSKHSWREEGGGGNEG